MSLYLAFTNCVKMPLDVDLFGIHLASLLCRFYHTWEIFQSLILSVILFQCDSLQASEDRSVLSFPTDPQVSEDPHFPLVFSLPRSDWIHPTAASSSSWVPSVLTTAVLISCFKCLHFGCIFHIPKCIFVSSFSLLFLC